MPMHACMCSWGGRESVSNRHFLVVVPQPIGFCSIKEWPIVALGSISRAQYVTSWQATSWHTAASTLHFVRCGHAEVEGRRKWGPWPTAKNKKKTPRKQQQTNLTATDFQRGTSDKYTLMVKSSLVVHHTTVM